MALTFPAVSSARMKELDSWAIERIGIPSLLLMENAGREVAREAARFFKIADPGIETYNKIDGIIQFVPRGTNLARRFSIHVLAGRGNNGGDGMAAARHLVNWGFRVTVILFAEAARLKEDPLVHYRILKNMKVPIQEIGTVNAGNSSYFLRGFKRSLSKSNLIIDALFGVGLTRPLAEPFVSVLEAVNDSKKSVLSIDVPSGLNADTGEIMGAAIKARVTVTLACPKKGFFLKEGPKYAGWIRVADISIPRNL